MWNYRIVKHKEYGYGIFEVYYDKKKKLYSIIDQPILGWYESIDEIKKDLEYLPEAFKHDTLNYEDF